MAQDESLEPFRGQKLGWLESCRAILQRCRWPRESIVKQCPDERFNFYSEKTCVIQWSRSSSRQIVVVSIIESNCGEHRHGSSSRMKVFAVALYARTPTHLPYKRVYVWESTLAQPQLYSHCAVALSRSLPMLHWLSRPPQPLATTTYRCLLADYSNMLPLSLSAHRPLLLTSLFE